MPLQPTEQYDIAQNLISPLTIESNFLLYLSTIIQKHNIEHNNRLDILLNKKSFWNALTWISKYPEFKKKLYTFRWKILPKLGIHDLEQFLKTSLPESYTYTITNSITTASETNKLFELDTIEKEIKPTEETINHWLSILRLYFLDTKIGDEIKDSAYIISHSEIKSNDNISIATCFCRYFILETKYHDIIKKIITCIEENDLSFTKPSVQYFPYTRIFFGAPGTGKSYIVDKEYITNKLDINKELHSSHVFRTVFHREYTYAHFFGQYKPVTLEHNTNGCWKPVGALPTSNTVQVVYTFSPGPFMKALAKAFSSSKNVVLVIEELNRGNAPAIFGELFQLLDRGTDGCSEVSIDISTDAMLWLIDAIQGPSNQSNTLPPIDIHQSKIYLPPNFHILATMNQSAQGVYALDTAFKRRWSFEYLPLETPNNEWEEKWNPLIDINGTKISWQVLRSNINKEIIKTSTDIPEDRLIGPYFLNLDDLLDDNISNAIKYKIIPYLWHDVIPRKRTTVFKEELLSLDAAINDSTLGFRACIFASPEGNK